MEKDNTSNPSMCRKIRQAIHCISSYPHQEPKPVTTGSNSSSSSSPINTAIQTKPPIPQHHKTNTESSGAIPIKCDYSTPPITTTKNENSAASRVHGQAQAPKVASPVVGNSEITIKVGAKGDDVFKGEQQHSEHKGKKSMDTDDTFNEYIKRAKFKLRTVSNLGRGKNINPVPEHEANHGTDKKENQKDQFSDFIHHAKKRFRTQTIVGKPGSMKRG